MERERFAQLSESGRTRRDDMLGELIDAMHEHHARRRIRRSIAASCAAVLLVVGAVYVVSSAGSTTPATPVTPTHVAQVQAENDTPPSTPAPTAHIVRVQTDPTIMDRYRATPPQLVTIIDDRELLEALHELNRPAGLVRMDEKVFVTASVADQRMHSAGRPNSL